ncbi:RNA methyltransferase [Lysinibacillus sp. SGAir0095]|uniref:TRM11 family SAM-dependent methyltransferase n=1 Tax=Lysinibacillus sp. SGAir0095 TaxID=2070463 RepID=UPI001F0EB2BD|nr:RNA methyltransferase [Lysinibacillus sp. SGAir0095]
MNKLKTQSTYIYTYVHHKNEHDLCRMEMRSFFGFDTQQNYLFSDLAVDPSRSPFMEERLEVMYEAETISDIKNLIKDMKVSASSYKVYCFNRMDIGETKKIPHPERRLMERELGLIINGEPDLDNPEIVFGLVSINNRWYFGKHSKSVSVWREHVHKPNSYSTALNTRVARAIANIAVPDPIEIRAIDPCCGIGTVVVEALSMGINIEGRDINPIVCKGARENIAYFNLKGTITKGPISEVNDHYDVCIIDLPYNLYTHISREEQIDIIKQARRISDKCLIVTIETIDDLIEEVGFKITDCCITKKHLFVRQILLCE